MPKEPLYIQPVSIDIAFGEPERNLDAIEAAVQKGLGLSPEIPAAERLFVFPELSLTGFVTKSPEAFEEGHPHLQRLRAIARGAGTALAAGYPSANPDDPGRPYNVLALIGPDGSTAGSYRKVHLFTWGKVPETEAYASGPGPALCAYRGWKIGLAVCFDIRFPRMFHEYAKAGADLILSAACWVGGPHKAHQFKTLNSAHAIQTQAYLAAVNRTGSDPAFHYEGGEFVFSPFGENLFKGAPVRLDPAEIDACRKLVVRPSDRADYPMARGVE